MKVFLSYHFDDARPEHERFVHRVSHHLRKQKGVEPYCYAEERRRKDWRRLVGREILSCDKLVLFMGCEFGGTQKIELQGFMDLREKEKAIFVQMPGYRGIPDEFFEHLRKPVVVKDANDETAEQHAREIYGQLTETPNLWIPDDGLPIGYPFDYEKLITDEFMSGNGHLVNPIRWEQGCPTRWPTVERIENSHTPQRNPAHRNPIPPDVIGNYREGDSIVVVDARSEFHSPAAGPGRRCLAEKKLTFLEAGPREELRYPLSPTLKVGIVVSGGIAPGINAVIAGIVQRHRAYAEEQSKRSQSDPASWPRYEVQPVLYRDGFSGVLKGRTADLNETDVRHQSNDAGSMISTSRSDDLLDLGDPIKREAILYELVTKLDASQIDILYVIGGEGSMRAAHALYTRARERWRSEDRERHINRRISVVAIPKTMDNDILWVWQSFGFLSAVEKAREFIVQLHTEAKSNPRLCVAQLFGSDSGFVVSHAVLASGVCKAALIPEVAFTMRGLSDYIRGVLVNMNTERAKRESKGQSPYAIIALAETAIPRDVEDYIDNPKYPDLQLEEGERDAIRKFVGSSLLTSDNVLDWRGLCVSLQPADNERRTPQHRIWELLPQVVQAIVKSISQSAETEAAVTSLILKALNNALKREDFYSKSDFQRLVLSPQVTDLLDLLEALKSLRASRSAMKFEELKSTVERLCTVPLPCEAIENLRALKRHCEAVEDLSKPEERSGDELNRLRKLADMSDDVFRRRIRRVVPRVVEKFNRLVLEACCSDMLAKDSTVPGDRRVHGQTPDALRTGGLKVVNHVLQTDIRGKMDDLGANDPDGYWDRYRVFKNEPRHLIRAIPPSVSDVIFGQRLGMLAVDNAMAGYTDFMVSQWLTEYVLVPLKLVVLGRKRVPQDGIFWKSVLANTGQPADLE